MITTAAASTALTTAPAALKASTLALGLTQRPKPSAAALPAAAAAGGGVWVEGEGKEAAVPLPPL